MVVIKLHSMFNTVNYNAGVVRSFDDEGARIKLIADVRSVEELGNR